MTKTTKAIVLGALLVAIASGSMVPDSLRPRMFAGYDFADHVIGYCVVAFAAMLLFRTLGWQRLTLALIAFAAAMEFIQWPIPSRDASLADLAHSTIGVLLGIAAGRMVAYVAPKVAGGWIKTRAANPSS